MLVEKVHCPQRSYGCISLYYASYVCWVVSICLRHVQTDICTWHDTSVCCRDGDGRGERDESRIGRISACWGASGTESYFKFFCVTEFLPIKSQGQGCLWPTPLESLTEMTGWASLVSCSQKTQPQQLFKNRVMGKSKITQRTASWFTSIIENCICCRSALCSMLRIGRLAIVAAQQYCAAGYHQPLVSRLSKDMTITIVQK